MANNQNLQPPFRKGDPRINRKGRPKSFDAARALAQEIAAEPLTGDNGAAVTNRKGYAITRIEALFRAMSSSRNPRDRELFLAYAVGKPKDQMDITSGGEKVIFEVVRKEIPDPAAHPAPEAGSLPEQPGQEKSGSGGQARGEDNGRVDAGG